MQGKELRAKDWESCRANMTEFTRSAAILSRYFISAMIRMGYRGHRDLRVFIS
jgi:hypothetical protein